MSTLKVMQPHWPTKNTDTIKIVTVGDWAILQNLFATITELSSKNSVRPGLAHSWEQSTDGKQWTFYLRDNTKWSDGSLMTLEQIKKSLERSIKSSTAHTSLGSYVKDISIENPNKVIFNLNQVPKNFLISLAMVDFGIVHPSAYSNPSLFSWDSPISGPYSINTFSDKKITLNKNEYYWDASKIDFEDVIIDRGMQSSADFKTFIENNYDAAQLGVGVISSSSELEVLNKSHSVFTASIDMNATLVFSRKRTIDNKLNDQIRSYLFKKIYDAFWKDRWDDPTRSVGLRPTGAYGALSKKEFDDLYFQIKIPDKIQIHKPVEILFGEHHKTLPIYSRIIESLNESNILYKVIFYPSAKLSKTLHGGDFDLMLIFQGAAEAEPDSAWRMFNSPNMAKPAATSTELDEAMLERDPQKRESMYKIFEKRIVSQSLSIPLKLESTFVVTGSKVKLDLEQAAHWGLQIYKLRKND